MKLSLKKLDVEDLATLGKLVAENVEGIEPGLHVIDSRLLLGHATIDLVAQDAWGSLVLVALGLKADEGMLLRIVDAYSWCLEYYDSVQRHYPTLTVSEERPPRIMFVTERVPDSFHRQIKQLNFPSLEAIEFRHIDVNGVPAAYFETVVRIRRSSAAASDAVPDISLRARPETPKAVPGDSVVRLNGNGNGHARQAAAPRFIEVEPVPERCEAAPGARAATIVVPAPVRIEGAVTLEAPVQTATVAVAPEAAQREVEESEPPAPRAIELASVAVETFASPAAEPEVEAAVATATAVEEPPTAGDASEAEGDAAHQKYLFREAAKASETVRDFGIQLPKDGALTRQWVDFLNQLANK